MSIYSRSNPPTGFYVYFYIRKDYTPYYVGKGSKIRAWVKHSGGIIIPKDRSKIIIVEDNLTELQSFILERYYIKWFGRKDNNTGILRNLTDGGEGNTGNIPWMKGKTHSTDTKQKMSNKLKGRKLPQSQIEKMKLLTGDRNPFFNKKHSPETIQLIKEKCKGRTPWNKGVKNPFDDKTLSKMRGRKLSNETKKIISERTKEGMKNIDFSNLPTKLCPHCNREFQTKHYYRWHGDNCKLIKQSLCIVPNLSSLE